MNTSGRWAMAILQIKGIDDALYSRLKQMAAEDSRSVSQEVLHLTKEYMARREAQNVDRASAEALLALAGSWEDDRDAAEIAREIRASRRNSDRGSLL
jgi:plasmid stability protein